MAKKEHTFIMKRITNEDIYQEIQEIKFYTRNQRWWNRAFCTGITLLALGFVILLKSGLK